MIIIGIDPGVSGAICILENNFECLESDFGSFCLGMEQRSLEEMLEALVEEVTNNVKTLQLLDKQLLDRLSGKSARIL